MISPTEADEAILAHAEAHPFPDREVDLAEAGGAVLRKPVRADRDAPPFDRVMLDGVAVAGSALADGQRRFRVVAVAPAGAPRVRLSDAAAAVEVMTGAPLPEGTDTVIPVEELSREGDEVRIHGRFEVGHGVHARGRDARAGEEALPAGIRLGPPALAVAATEGATRLTVSAQPRIVLLTTGDEVVPPSETPLPHQIRASHPAALRALFASFGFSVWAHRHAADEAEPMTAALEGTLAEVDVVLLTGGVSKGRRDIVPDLLREAGVERVFHGVRQKPGKPLWFGIRGGQLVFGFPGNPISALVCARRYAIPALERASGLSPRSAPRICPVDELKPNPTLFTFPLVRWEAEGWRLRATPNSGALHAAALTDGFLECPENRTPKDGYDFYGWGGLT